MPPEAESPYRSIFTVMGCGGTPSNPTLQPFAILLSHPIRHVANLLVLVSLQLVINVFLHLPVRQTSSHFLQSLQVFQPLTESPPVWKQFHSFRRGTIQTDTCLEPCLLLIRLQLDLGSYTALPLSELFDLSSMMVAGINAFGAPFSSL